MIFDGSKFKFHELLETQDFTGTLPFVTAHVLQIARGSSLARISLLCGVAVSCLCFASVVNWHGAKHSSFGGPFKQSRGSR